MGDTGAMALGGAIAAMAIMLKVEFLLLFVGGIFVIEALSVMLQVLSFKWFGRRIFLMAPLHHHFEMKAWSETKIMVRFWIVTGDPLRRRLRALLQVLPAASGRIESARLRPRAVRPLVGRAARGARRRGRARRPHARQRGRPLAARRRRRGRQVARRAAASAARARRARRGIQVWSEVELGFRLLPGTRFVGVTGTNGKTTTTELLGAIFRAAGRDVAVAGNVGRPLTSLERGGLGRLRAVVVPARGRARRSPATSRCCSTSSPTTSTGTASFEAYRDAKLRIFERARAKIVPRGLGLDGIEFAADDELPAEPLHPRRAQPRERGRGDRGGARGRDRRRAHRRGAAHLPRRAAPARARRRASAAFASSTTRRRPTSPRRGARSRRTPASPCT